MTVLMAMALAGYVCAASEDRELNQVVATIEKMPPWTVAKSKENEIIASLAALDAWPTARLRNAVVEYVKRRTAAGEYSLAEMSKVFLLNRFIFRVPESEGQDVRFFGGWYRVPFTNGVANLMWPLGYTDQGTITIKGRYEGYAGPPYRGVEEFDFFAKRYGRRRSVGR